MSYVRSWAESLDYPWSICFIANGGIASLLGNIIIESHVQIVVVREKLPQEEFPCVIIESH